MINSLIYRLKSAETFMKNKSFLQKTSLVVGIISELLCIFCLVMLFLKAQELGMKDVISASYMASAFFFFTTGIVFMIISQTNIPSLSFNDAADDK